MDRLIGAADGVLLVLRCSSSRAAAFVASEAFFLLTDAGRDGFQAGMQVREAGAEPG